MGSELTQKGEIMALGRGNWHYDHPPYCTCKKCERAKRTAHDHKAPKYYYDHRAGMMKRTGGARLERPTNARSHAGNISLFPTPRSASKLGGALKGFFSTLAIIAIVGVIVIFATNNESSVLQPTKNLAGQAAERVRNIDVPNVDLPEADLPEPPQSYKDAEPLNPRNIEIKLVELTNIDRQRHGLRELQPDARIDAIARQHSRDMALSGQFSHDLFGKDSTDRALDAGYTCTATTSGGGYTYGLSENIYEHPRVRSYSGRNSYNSSDFVETDAEMAANIQQGWMASPGHRENILDPTNRRIGVGIYIMDHAQMGEVVYATVNFSGCW